MKDLRALEKAAGQPRIAAFASLLEAEWYNGNLSENVYERLNTDLHGVSEDVDRVMAVVDAARELVDAQWAGGLDATSGLWVPLRSRLATLDKSE